MKLYQIGHFSTITKITVKALRLYHEKGILLPTHIDQESGYRYYNEKLLERAFTIQNLKQLDFSLKEIAEIMRKFSEDSEMVPFLRAKADELKNKIDHFHTIKNQLELLVITQEKQAMQTYSEKIEIRHLPDLQIASIRFKGKYAEVGIYFKKLFKRVGFHVAGKPGSLYYDGDYREDDADIEAFIPVKQSFKKSDLASRLLPGGKAYCLIHIGSYDTLNRSYKKMLDYLTENKLTAGLPSREIYLKGPGLIFKGNPDKFVTELQFLAEQ